MTITIIAVGRPHEPHISDAIKLYESRLQRFCNIEWIILPSAGLNDPARIRKAESDAIRARLRAKDTVLLLDERGHHWTSPELARKVNSWQSTLRGRLVCVIGGAYGVDEALQKQATNVWSLSKLVFPHQLVRVILIEQLYRAYAIIHSLPYHHS